MKIGIDIGGSHIAIATVNREGKIVEKIEKEIINTERKKINVVDYVDKSIEKLSKTVDIEEIGIAIPGNISGTVVTNIVNLGITKINFKPIEEKHNIKIKCINDAKAAALAEKKYGAMKDSKDSVFLCLGTGIGGAVFLNDRLLQANRNPGFELGHIIIDKNGNQCNCGKKGCFEAYCSMKRLKEKLQTILEQIFLNRKIANVIELKRLIYENKEDIRIKQVLDEYLDNLIIGLSNVIDIFEPEVIVLGGSFVYFEDILYHELVLRMQERKYVFNKNSLPEIKLAKLQNDAGIIGATLII